MAVLGPEWCDGDGDGNSWRWWWCQDDGNVVVVMMVKVGGSERKKISLDGLRNCNALVHYG